MKKTIFVVEKCTPNQKGGFVWKLVVTTIAEAFGLKKEIKRTYYIGGMPAEATKAQQFEEDLNRFEIVERPFVKDGITMSLKWLHVKPV